MYADVTVKTQCQEVAIRDISCKCSLLQWTIKPYAVMWCDYVGHCNYITTMSTTLPSLQPSTRKRTEKRTRYFGNYSTQLYNYIYHLLCSFTAYKNRLGKR
jgi:hypothetical protein